MLSLRELDLKKNYDSSIDDIIDTFYYPVLSTAKQYDRIAGFFTSSSLAVASRGIAELIKNNGKMRLLVSPHLQKEDVEEINNSHNSPLDYYYNYFLNDVESIQEFIMMQHVKALGWMLKNKTLEIRIAIPFDKDKVIIDDGLFHQKVGIIYDDENIISFSGSINETAKAWTSNIEEFKTFRSWEKVETEYLQKDINKFNSMWNGKRNSIKIFDIPDAFSQKLIKISENYSNENLSKKKYISEIKTKQSIEKLSLFDYQKQAISEWENNGNKLLFQMATGTGKTRTAIGCICKLINKKEKFITIIACPQSTLSQQWRAEIEKLGIKFDDVIITDSTNRNWRDKFQVKIDKLLIGITKNLLVLSTHATCSSKKFIEIIQNNHQKLNILFIGDETHGLGASKSKLGLLETYKYRVGLSATPTRWFDDFGSNIIQNYYGNKTFEFSISDALVNINPITGKPYLVDFFYDFKCIELTDEELELYKKISKSISRLHVISKKNEEYQKLYESLLFKRAKITKNAENKYNALISILEQIQDIKNTIIFVESEQLQEVSKILSSKNIIFHKFTQEEKTIPQEQYGGISEREYLIKNFKDGVYQVLVAIKCLDEGIDIPSAETAIIMASSTNPREYIQRIGRVIRQTENKNKANIIDFVVTPDFSRLEDFDLIQFEKQILEKELRRINELAKNAINNASAMEKADFLMEKLNEYKSKNTKRN